MLKRILSLFRRKSSVASIVSDLEKVRAKLSDHQALKAAEAELHEARIAAAKIAFDAAQAEIAQARKVASNLGSLLAA